jgi:hypothetical protein
VTNWAFSEGKEHLLGFRVDWVGRGGPGAPDAVDTANIIDVGLRDRPALAADTANQWWIEERGAWVSAQSQDVVFPVFTEPVDIVRGDVVRFGQTIFSGKSKAAQISRMISCIDLGDDEVTYNFVWAQGPVNCRLRCTNDSSPLIYRDWSSALDSVIEGRLTGDVLAGIDCANVAYAVRFDSANQYGDFSTLGAFCGVAKGF